MAEKPVTQPISLDIDILKANNRTILPVTGLFGGLTNQNELVVHLYVEYPDLPTSGKVTIDMEKRKLLENSLAFRNTHVTREIVSTIVIQANLVQAFANWFQSQASMLAMAKPVDMK